MLDECYNEMVIGFYTLTIVHNVLKYVWNSPRRPPDLDLGVVSAVILTTKDVLEQLSPEPFE